ncbi:unnamed protein product [Symbiodinium natans]|uniref:Transmembrane protein n=1 Tax=Symbiodinium natans TaxID=878477 RepID=A0A812JJ35_9DINO|nr:unnamed protein product [Symbiodinium natans]
MGNAHTKNKAQLPERTNTWVTDNEEAPVMIIVVICIVSFISCQLAVRRRVRMHPASKGASTRPELTSHEVTKETSNFEPEVAPDVEEASHHNSLPLIQVGEVRDAKDVDFVDDPVPQEHAVGGTSSVFVECGSREADEADERVNATRFWTERRFSWSADTVKRMKRMSQRVNAARFRTDRGRRSPCSQPGSMAATQKSSLGCVCDPAGSRVPCAYGESRSR